MTRTQLTYIRTGATVVITVLTGLMSVYPHSMWVPLIAAAVAAGSAVGIHAIPSISQNPLTGGITMTTPLTGAQLMGIAPLPTPVAEPTPEPTPVATEPTPYVATELTPYPLAATEPTPVGVYEPTPVVTPVASETASVDVTSVDPSVKALLANVISGLQKIADMLP
jgi:hypothetical protein